MFENDDEVVKVRSKPHKIKHQMFGIFVCTGMAHLVLTTFDVPGISYIRIFLVGAAYIALSLSIKMGHEKAVYLSIATAVFSMFGALFEFLLLGGHFIPSSLVLFDGLTIFLVLSYLRVKDLPLPDGLGEDDQGLLYQRRMQSSGSEKLIHQS